MSVWPAVTCADFHFGRIKRKGKVMGDIKETESHFVVEFTSQSGKKYEVGYPKEGGYSKEDIEDTLNASNAGNLDQNSANSEYATLVWTVNGDSTTSRAAMNIGIVGGYVNKGSGKIYDCQVTFSNTEGMSFRFMDQSGDTYWCSAPRNGNHYINYNSDKPSIIGVK